MPQQPFMERPIDCKAGYKHHVTNEYLKHLQKSLMDLCNREFLYQVDLLSPSRTGVTEAEYWAQRRLDERKQEIEREGFTPNPTKFQTQKQLIRDAVAAARHAGHGRDALRNYGETRSAGVCGTAVRRVNVSKNVPPGRFPGHRGMGNLFRSGLTLCVGGEYRVNEVAAHGGAIEVVDRRDGHARR